MLHGGRPFYLLTSPYNAMVRFPFNRKSALRKDKFTGLLSPSYPSMKTYVTVFLFLLLTAGVAPLQAATLSLLPWQLIGWDAEFPTRHKASLAAIHQAIESSWMTQAQGLDRWAEAQGRALSLNQKRRTASLRIGQAASNLGFEAYLVPILCPVGTKLVFALELVELSSQVLIGGQQILLDPARWEQTRLTNETRNELVSQLNDLRNELEADAQRNRQAEPIDAMKLNLSLLRGAHDSRHGAHLCLNMLMAHSLVKDQRILAPLGQLESGLLRQTLGITTPSQRFTRILAFDWGQDPKGPERFIYEARWAEGVLAGVLDRRLKGEAVLQQQPARLEPPASLRSLLNSTKEQLVLKDGPQVAKIRGAWVYLDRGRAWGLDLDDRLYLDDGQRRIKGHVVGFYGPGLGLQSTRGYRIQEGAIVYIRQGQREVKVGDMLRFDPTRFPTPWPPVRQPAQAAGP
jgi:hypothetical protein